MEVSPAVLEFKGPFTQPSTEKLVLTNTSNETLAFKVKTTAPKLYCVRPNASIVQPGKSLEVSIISQGLKQEPAADFKCKDKFLLVTLPCPNDDAETKVAELWPSLESEFKSTSKKIKVNYIIPESSSKGAAAPAPKPASKAAPVNVPFASGVPAAVAAAAAAAPAESKEESPAAADTSFATTHQQVPAAIPEDAPLEPSTTISKETQISQAPKTSGIPLPLVLIIAILAFLLGKYFL